MRIKHTWGGVRVGSNMSPTSRIETGVPTHSENCKIRERIKKSVASWKLTEQGRRKRQSAEDFFKGGESGP